MALTNPASQNVITSVPRTLPLHSWDHYVLVVEDDPELLDSYRAALRAAGFAAVGTEDGFDALRLAELQRPSVIVIDFVPPRLNGRLVHQTLKSNPHTRNIPIVAINGPDHRDLNLDDVACLLRKPVDARTLVVAVQHIVRQSAPHRPEDSDHTPRP